MSESVRELLQRGAETVERPRFDPDDLVARAERRLARRRLASAVASVAAVALVTAGGFALGPDHRPGPGEPAPATKPPPGTPRTLYYDRGTSLNDMDERNVVVPPGVYSVPFSGWGDLPPDVADLRAVVTFPAGYTSLHRSTFEKDTPEADVTLGFWTVDRIPNDFCARVGPAADLSDPGPTVAALANALSAQPRLGGTDPSPVTIGGHHGLYVELTRPQTCAGAVLWTAPRIAHTAYHEQLRVSGDVARVWILDVNGDRVVIDSVHPSGAREKDVDEVTRMVDSTTFMTLEQP